jgi:putative photosynthetic complex assembly protein
MSEFHVARDHDPQVPRWAVRSAAAMLAVVILLALAPRLGLVAPPPSPVEQQAQAGGQVLAARALTFADLPDGSVAVTDAATGARVATLEPAENRGFVRGVLRALARERRQGGAGPEQAFQLELWSTGALTLTDPATGRVVELSAFGQTNREAFLGFLPGRAGAQAAR